MKKILKRGMSGLLAVLMAFTVLAGFGTTTAFAASETAESYMISFPRDGTLLRFTPRTHGDTPRKNI
mgnify:FL=1